MNNWTIGKRIVSGFAAVLLITLTLGLFVFFQLRSIQTIAQLLLQSLPVLGLRIHVWVEDRVACLTRAFGRDRRMPITNRYKEGQK